MKNDGTASRRGSLVIQTMLARLAREEEEYTQRKSGENAKVEARPKAMAAHK